MAGIDRDTPIPTEIKLHQKSRKLELAYATGEHYELNCEYLRVFTPPQKHVATVRDKKHCKPGSAMSKFPALNPSAPMPCAWYSPMVTIAASIPGICSTTWGCTRKSFGAITLNKSRRRDYPAISTALRGSAGAAVAVHITKP